MKMVHHYRSIVPWCDLKGLFSTEMSCKPTVIIRVGSVVSGLARGAVLARDIREEHMVELVDLIDSVLSAVAALCKAYPLPG